MKTSRDFLPKRQGDLHTWQTMFLQKLSVHGQVMGFLPAQLIEVQDAINLHQTTHAAMMSKKQEANNAVAEYEAAGIEAIRHIRKITQQIKNIDGYTEAIGEDMGIIGIKVENDMDELKPVLKAEVNGGTINVRFKKAGLTGINIYSKRGDEPGFTFLTKEVTSPFIDHRPHLDHNKPERREYYAYYFDKKVQVGEPSSIETIVV